MCEANALFNCNGVGIPRLSDGQQVFPTSTGNDKSAGIGDSAQTTDRPKDTRRSRNVAMGDRQPLREI
jgi:hypothetical protein